MHMTWIDKLCRIDECVTIGKCKIIQLLFADDLVLLASSESGLQCASNGFAATCYIAGIKISTFKTKSTISFEKSYPMFSASRRSIFEADGKDTYFGIAFASDGKQNKERVGQ